MRHFLLVILFILTLQSFSNADDIGDIEIEGISISGVY